MSTNKVLRKVIQEEIMTLKKEGFFDKLKSKMNPDPIKLTGLGAGSEYKTMMRYIKSSGPVDGLDGEPIKLNPKKLDSFGYDQRNNVIYFTGDEYYPDRFMINMNTGVISLDNRDIHKDKEINYEGITSEGENPALTLKIGLKHLQQAHYSLTKNDIYKRHNDDLGKFIKNLMDEFNVDNNGNYKG